jgi:4'-phosphopantetheinyl transferase
MPLDNLELSANRTWGVWKISEDEQWLSRQIAPHEQIADELRNPYKRLEFAASRVLLKTLLANWHLPFEGLIKDGAGKPYLRNSDFHISLSHSYPYVAAIIDKEKSVGIDLEQPKDKLLRIAERVLNNEELRNAGNDIVKHCVVWCAKETLIKIYGKKHLVFASELAIEPFQLQKDGILTGRIIANDMKGVYQLHYHVYDNFVLVLNN